MKIGIIGKGFVGNATGKVLEKAHQVVYYDKYKEEFKDVAILDNCDAIFICVPTPTDKNGSIDLQIVYEVLILLKSFFTNLIVIKSTVIPGFCDTIEKLYSLKIAFNPEFLKQKTATKDAMNPDKIILGKYHKELFEIYKPIFPQKKYNYVFCSNKEAEMIKYACNIMLTGQIGIANELYRACQCLEIDYEVIKKSMLLDKRIGRNLDVPGPDGKFGFGGACFPKDLNAFINCLKENNYHSYLLEELWRSNKRIR